MSSQEPNADALPDFSEFLADYFIETDEHLAAARQSVLDLEASLTSEDIDRETLDDLFRSFHSLKGLSAMVEFRDAELLAHHLETFLVALRRNEVSLQLDGVEALVAGVAALERIIAARQGGSAVPPPDELVAQLSQLIPASADEVRTQEAASAPRPRLVKPRLNATARITERLKIGGRAWQVTFEPSADLLADGIDVNSVRAKLKEFGDLAHSEPTVDSSGRVVFSFVVIGDSNDDLQTQLQLAGVAIAPYLPKPGDDAEATFAPTSSPPTPSGQPSPLAPSNLVRVDLDRLDDLMRLVGELVLSRARLGDSLVRLESCAPAAEMRALQETTSSIERQLRDLREGVMRVRMVPVREVFARMQFVVRDLTRESGKRAALRLQGEDTQIDKYIVERMMDPLLHLVRNAISHGLENPDDRLAAGKPVTGVIHLRARTTGDTVLIEVEDDGRGIDEPAVMLHAEAKGLSPGKLAGESPVLLDVLCAPGFSTRESTDRASGRGVGMDVVRRSVEELGGALSLQSELGKGSRFTIQLPLTLAIIDALIVTVGDERYAVPQVAVREVLRVEDGTTTLIENNELIPHQGGVLPLLRLAEVFRTAEYNRSSPFALVIGKEGRSVALAVDRVLGLREVVVRPLADRIVQVAGIAGATELGDGKVVLILDTTNLARAVRAAGSRVTQG